jgi:hypothetical protein
MLCSGASGPVDAVDIYNAISGAWSTAVLSVPRYSFAAASLPLLGVALFAGGEGALCWSMLIVLRWKHVGSIVNENASFMLAWLCAILQLLIPRVLRRCKCLRHCRHLQCNGRILEHHCSQRCSKWACSHVAACAGTCHFCRRARCRCSQHHRRLYRVSCRLALHHRHTSMQPLCTWLIQPLRRPSRLQLLRRRLIRQRIRPLDVRPLFRVQRLPAKLHHHSQLRLRCLLTL